MKKTQKELLSLGKTKRNQQGYILVFAVKAFIAIVGVGVVSVVCVSVVLSLFYKPTLNNMRLLYLTTVIDDINQTPTKCIPKKGVPIHNDCKTVTGEPLFSFEYTNSVTSKDNTEIAFYDNSIIFLFEGIGSTAPKPMMLKVVENQNIIDQLVVGNQNIIDQLKDKNCETTVATTAPSVTLTLSACHYISGELFILLNDE